MFGFSKAKPVIGLDIGSSSIKAAQLTGTKSGYKLERFGIKTLAPELIVDGTVMDAGRVVDALRELLAEVKTKARDVVVSISGHSVIVKKIGIPAMSEEELEESIKWEAEQYIPFDINDVNIDFHILGQTEGAEGQAQMNVLLVAAKKDKLTEYTSLVAEVGLNPVIVDVDAFAVENIYGVNYDIQDGEVTVLVNIGASVMNINVLKNGTSTFTRDISIGGNRYTEMIQRELHLDYEEAEKAKRFEGGGASEEAVMNVLSTINSELASEVVRSIDYFRTTSTQENIDKVMLCGGCSKVRGLVDALKERVGAPIEITNPFKNITVDSKAFDMNYLEAIAPQASVVMGLAIRKPGDR